MEASARTEDRAQPASAWLDLATLALLAQAEELHVCPDHIGDTMSLCGNTLLRLKEIVGSRPRHYWRDLIYHAQVLGVLRHDNNQWVIQNLDAEILGATRREVFPALCAVWLKHPTPLPQMQALGLTGPQDTMLRLDVLRLLGLFEPDKWYPYERFGDLLRLACHRQNRPLSQSDTDAVSKTLIERTFLMISALDINEDGDHFRIHSGLQLPPLPPEAAAFRKQPCRAEAYRKILTQKLQKTQSWRHVASGLMRCMEVRRGRNSEPDTLKCLSEDGPLEGLRLETDPTMPFRDCLFLARVGRLVPTQHINKASGCPGSYVFELDRERLHHVIRDGLCPQKIQSFFQHRCCDMDLPRVQSTLPEPIKA